MTEGTKAADKKWFDSQDVLYWCGAVLVVVGLAMSAGPEGGSRALVAAGAFCLFPPLTSIVSSFIRGLRR
jgi:hypothetical protein